jgi:hypothetical protein
MFSLSASVNPDLTLYLYLGIDKSWPNASLRANYVKAVKEHNERVDNKNYPSGFDLYLPEPLEVDGYSHILEQNGLFCDLKVKAAMYKGKQPVSYSMNATPSLEETPLRLPVNPRPIDSDYRDNLNTTFDIISKFEGEWVSKEHHKLLKICYGSYKQFRVVIVDTVEELNK